MTREELILKWLNNDLNSAELEAFKALEDHAELERLSKAVNDFKAPAYDVEEELDSLWENIEQPRQRSRSPFSPFIRIAAAVVIAFGVYFYTTTLDTTAQALAAAKTTLELPDASSVQLNALSTLTYNKMSWDKVRDVTLDGEAYFKVAKGSSFSVNTPSGTVTVLGTEFNVKHRNGLFEVICYEGSVGVTHKLETVVLKPGDSFLIIDGKIIAKEKELASAPSWINNQSYFKSMPYDQVLREFERQYNVTINLQHIDDDQLFTGSFVHNNRELALKSITLPLNLNYSIEDNRSIVLTRE